MNNLNMNNLDKYYVACNKLAGEFVEKYYGTEYLDDYSWVADSVGEILIIRDEFYDMTQIAEIMKLEATEGQVFDWYHMKLDYHMKGETPPINFENYIKLNPDV